MPFAQAAGHRLEYRHFEGTHPPIVMLHEGLGSVSMWKGFPEEVARATGHEIWVYSRYGHGESDPLPGPRQPRYMHDEALDALRDLLQSLGIERPILLGHSDGASIALIHAGAHPQALAGLIVLAPHVFVEDLSTRSIAATGKAYFTTDLRTKLARHHRDVDHMFRGWNDIWLHPDFRRWNIEEYLPSIGVPVLAVQGRDDEYGTMEQLRRIVQAIPRTIVVELENCGHSPHRDQPEVVLAAICRFVPDCQS